ncbi:MAG: hypothetical protein ACM3RX_04175, partial [Methanococcaceae archaeon]
MNRKYLTCLILYFLTAALLVYGEGDNKNKTNGIKKTTGNPVRTFMDINNLSTYIYNDGNSDIDQNGNSGLIYPKGSGKTAAFESGFIWGAKVPGDPQVRVGGSAYSSGLQPGKIISPGVAESPDLDKNRIYRVRPDIFPGGPFVDLALDATIEASSTQPLRDQYDKDWTEWPAADGAPYYDGNHNGKYDPVPKTFTTAEGQVKLDSTSDIPGVQGADQSIWFVANDLDGERTKKLYGTLPLGIEMQGTFWAYSQTGALGNMFFRKFRIINKSNTVFDDMYVSMWSDVDLGNATDDFAGCDTLLSLGYTFNASATDATYNPLPPPATGFDFFQGPKVNGTPLPMTAFYYFARGDASVTDPTTGSNRGADQFYNFMQGKIGLTGNYFVDPNTHRPTPFALPGDPQTRTGWIDGQLIGAGDRRMGLASGPFTMAIGDTQDVVVAEIVAGAIPGMDRLSAVGLLKFYDKKAQFAYDNNFNLPVAPPAPEVKVTELDREIVLDWGEDVSKIAATEEFHNKGYNFEGYNVYQLPSASAGVSEGKRIATFDILDNVGKIEDEFFDPKTGVVAIGVQQFGNETGIQRFLDIKTDELKGGTPLINGIRYYFAVTSYGYNPDPNVPTKTLENPLKILTVIPHQPAPGNSFTATGVKTTVVHTGLADAVVNVNVVDPTKVTGHQYEIFFDNQSYYLDSLGVWRTTNFPDSIGKLRKDVSPAKFNVVGVWSTKPGYIDLKFTLDLDTSNTAATGFTLTFPPGIVIDSAQSVATGNGTTDTAVVVGNTVSYGIITPDTLEGNYLGGEVVTIRIPKTSPPLSIGYTIFDDGQNGAPVNAVGTAIMSSIGNQFVTQDRWNIKDLTINKVLATGLTIFGGQDIYAGVLGPGGSTKSRFPGVGVNNNPIIDGLQFQVTGSFAAPATIDHETLNGEPLTIGTGKTTVQYDLGDFTEFGDLTGTTNEAYGYGTLDVNQLQQDYEFRFTGTIGDTTINGKTVFITKDGGSMATFFGARQYNMSLHPLNPTGTDAPFLVRIPFEVWNLDTKQQVNYEIYDRSNANPAADSFQVFTQSNRIYANIINTPYNPSAVIPAEGSPDATWTNVWYATHFNKGDVIDVFYANPIQPALDKYDYTSPAPLYSVAQAKQDVNNINVFPNPYYGVNSEELNKYNRFVT